MRRGRESRIVQPQMEERMANKIQYEIILYWSKEDQAFIAEVPELAGCAADGATYQEAIVNAEVVIREWIETALELGRPVPEPRGRLIYA
jgi:predicted RNase H-like HicB family nuclease